MLKTGKQFELVLTAEAYSGPDTAAKLKAGGKLLFAQMRLRQQQMPTDTGLDEGRDLFRGTIGLESEYRRYADLEQIIFPTAAAIAFPIAAADFPVAA